MTMSIPKSSWVKAAAAAADSFGLASAGASVITFEPGVLSTVNAPYAPLLTHFDEIDEGAYAMVPYSSKAGAQNGVDLVGALVDGSDVANTCAGLVCPTNNLSSFFVALNDGVLALLRGDGQPGVLVQKFDASFVAVPGDKVGATSLILRVDGYGASGLLARNDFYLPGPAADGSYSFATYTLDQSFANASIGEVDFYGYFCSGASCVRNLDKAQFALDNIVVPEPAGLWLVMVAGLAAVGAKRRRAA